MLWPLGKWHYFYRGDCYDNRTIAVDPTQIPYGSKVVINGQVYVAEDCGGAIKHNCIDIYVATHQEGEDKGVYYTAFIC